MVLMFLTYNLKSQVLYKTDKSYSSDIKAFVVDKEYQADLLVFIVKNENQAKGNDGKWFFANYKSTAKKSIFFTEKEYQADLKVFFVNSENRAGWKNKSKSHLFL